MFPFLEICFLETHISQYTFQKGVSKPLSDQAPRKALRDWARNAVGLGSWQGTVNHPSAQWNSHQGFLRALWVEGHLETKLEAVPTPGSVKLLGGSVWGTATLTLAGKQASGALGIAGAYKRFKQQLMCQHLIFRNMLFVYQLNFQ